MSNVYHLFNNRTPADETTPTGRTITPATKDMTPRQVASLLLSAGVTSHQVIAEASGLPLEEVPTVDCGDQYRNDPSA